MAQKLTATAESAAHGGVLADLAITTESTTSRVLVNNPLLRVVYFAFDTGELLTEHSSPRAVLVTLLSGAIRFSYEGREVAMVPGDLIYLAPGVVHSLEADQPSHLSLVLVDAG